MGEDFYDSFIAYQTQMLGEFDQMSAEYGFQVIDASRPLQRVATDLRRVVARVIRKRAASSVVGSTRNEQTTNEPAQIEQARVGQTQSREGKGAGQS